MKRLVSFAAAACASVMLFAPTAGIAQPTGFYTATLTASPAKDTVITGETLWKCNSGVCVANKSPMRDLILCQKLAGSVGQLQGFSVQGTAMEADALAKCNSRAK